jgi:hypothetical protein
LAGMPGFEPLTVLICRFDKFVGNEFEQRSEAGPEGVSWNSKRSSEPFARPTGWPGMYNPRLSSDTGLLNAEREYRDVRNNPLVRAIH